MKKILIITLTLSAILVISSCSKDDQILGSDNIESQFREVPQFSKVSSDGIFIVNILQGPEQSLEVITNDNIINRLKTAVSNNKLRIYLLDGNYGNISVEVNITVPNLNELQNFGTGDISVTDFTNHGNMKIENSGVGSVRISGVANTLDIKNEGSGTIQCTQFISNLADIEIIGSGDCEVYCTEVLNVNIEGSGHVYYRGNPIINANISGSGNVINVN